MYRQKTAGRGRLCRALVLAGLAATPAAPGIPAFAAPSTEVQAAKAVVKGTVKDDTGEPLMGVTVMVKGTQQAAITDLDGNYSIAISTPQPVLTFSYVGYAAQDIPVGGRGRIDVTMQEDRGMLQEVVVTAMGIVRKEASLTYSTQKVKADDLTRVQDPNVVNSLEGKVSGITITPSAGGAGGASKIVLRGNKSILGNSSPLIVVDGVPMTNNIRNQKGAMSTNVSGSEGADPLSMINPDDIESINVLKGANAAALYGSVAANGVVMITTKKGREGRLNINFSSNVTFDTPLLTPQLQNTYGAAVGADGTVSPYAWGGKIADMPQDRLSLTNTLPAEFYTSFKSKEEYVPLTQEVRLRNYAADDVADFFRLGSTTNNSLSLSGGTEKLSTYFSYANSHANGMVRNNTYNRNTFAFRVSYKMFDRLTVDASMDYLYTKTANRPGAGGFGNPLYNLYLTPRNVDMGWYAENYKHAGDRNWRTPAPYTYYERNQRVSAYPQLSGPMQNWLYMGLGTQNNPYWLTNMNTGVNRESLVRGMVSGTLQIADGLSLQARLSFNNGDYNAESRRYATTMLPNAKDDYGRYWLEASSTREIYTDYLLSYNKEFAGKWDVSATAGWVGHTIKGKWTNTDTGEATYVKMGGGAVIGLPKYVNVFDASMGGTGTTTQGTSSNWDKALLFTGQVGWNEALYADFSYRQDWYRTFRQFKGRGTPDNYGYFGVGANAIVSSLAKLPAWVSYLKYRASYSEVGNSLPNSVFQTSTFSYAQGSWSVPAFAEFDNPVPEKTKSFETGIEAQFFRDRLSLDLTYYNTLSVNQYMTYQAAGKTVPVNSGKVRNSGVEATVGYNFKFGRGWTWRTSYNFSYNDNEILQTSYNAAGESQVLSTDLGNVYVLYKKGGSIGDLYAPDFVRNEDGTLKLTREAVTIDGKTGYTADATFSFETDAAKRYSRYLGNMNSKVQMGWSNTFSYKDFNVFFLINGRVGGKVLSLSEVYYDQYGVSQRTADARLAAEASGITTVDGQPGMELPDGSGRIVAVQSYYQRFAASGISENHVYDATNFRLRELSVGYTFRDLFGENRNLSVSLIGRNLFFLYKKAPVDPDVSLSTANGLNAIDLFNMPSARSFGVSLKLNI